MDTPLKELAPDDLRSNMLVIPSRWTPTQYNLGDNETIYRNEPPKPPLPYGSLILLLQVSRPYAVAAMVSPRDDIQVIGTIDLRQWSFYRPTKEFIEAYQFAGCLQYACREHNLHEIMTRPECPLHHHPLTKLIPKETSFDMVKYCVDDSQHREFTIPPSTTEVRDPHYDRHAD